MRVFFAINNRNEYDDEYKKIVLEDCKTLKVAKRT